MNKMVSLLSSCNPDSVALPASLSVNDQKLIDGKAGMIATDEAIDQLYSKFGDAYEDMPELAALDAARNGVTGNG
jgi:hypothetical protein